MNSTPLMRFPARAQGFRNAYRNLFHGQRVAKEAVRAPGSDLAEGQGPLLGEANDPERGRRRPV
jgi:hypothetical protein